MAVAPSQEASSSTFRYNYQVFLSFRGEDTRKAFTDHLYTALVRSGVRTFRDDNEIQRGKRLDLELRKGIQQSRVPIIVFSKNYASSTWCLNEVVMILEWSRSSSLHEVLPIFYDVDPSDVRNQKGSIGEAFASFKRKHIDAKIDDEKKKEWTEKLQDWKEALTEVANLTGMVLQNQANGHEAKFIEEIIEVIKLKLNRAVLHVDPHLVGMHYRVRNIDSWIQNSSSSEAILVIYGMGGIGKTTIAKYVYNSNSERFKGRSCFLASVKEKAQQRDGLVKLQMQLLSSILTGKQKEIYDVDQGIIRIDEAICFESVFLVIDDVDEVEQVDALLGTRMFYPGSKIIITTRNKSLLIPHEVHKLHMVEELDHHESLELFCWHAFRKELPPEGYEELSKRTVYHCGGLPLAHRILGSSLAGKSIKVWESTLDKLEAIPEPKIQNVLKISFDSLPDNHNRNLFLHIACFFVGHNKDETIEILDACDFFTTRGIEDLVDRCLISIVNNDIMMHQLLQEMGRQIVDKESPKEPGRRSRLWRSKDSFIVLKKNKGTETIEALALDMQMYEHDTSNVRKGKKRLYDECCGTFSPSIQGNSLRRCYSNFLSSEPSSDVVFNYDAFSMMDNLSLLKLNYAKMTGPCKNFPEGLRWLCWHGFPSESIPFDLPLEYLVSLDMSYSKLERVWVENKVLLSLKILNLSHSQRLVETPNFEGLVNLEKLILEGCVSLVEVSDTIRNLKSLDLLNLKNCKSLRKFPNIGKLNSLQTLVVDGCSKILGESLKVVDANEVSRNPSPSTQQWLSKPILKSPDHISVSFPRSLVSLSLRDCNISDDDFPLDLSQLSMLEDLDLSKNHFRILPQCIRSLNKLSTLKLVKCEELQSIPCLPDVSRLDLDDCFSLESVRTYQSASLKALICSYGCSKLQEVQGMFRLVPLSKVNREILDNLGLCRVELIRPLKFQFAYSFARIREIHENTPHGLHEFGIFSTYLGQKEIPSWCVDGSIRGSSSVSFVVSSHHIPRIRGLNVYTLCCLCPNPDASTYIIFTKIKNKTKDLCWIYCPTVVAIPEKDEQQLVWVSHWKFGNQLESGDEVDVSIIAGRAFEVKEVGINLVWGEEEEEEEEEVNTRNVIGGDLSFFQFMTGTFFLANRAPLPVFDSKSWISKLFEGRVEYKAFCRSLVNEPYINSQFNTSHKLK